ncbi:dCMP deaminase family protein [Alicyclobacillus fastidiosus]|uniref:dCMP deaminase family protein n=1 Tax=Alicyclobacillus fastidiosus TaxID=392011 RepID=A0ABY6ZHK1_9BACL|nr:dCMP deaminase family protein [Alicyclobacillus fastidiosus]WAH42220.1 dCMP deaminase family protein [Alicyclobacillus fastidiosus]GMA64013.1 dCMP deaminase [Alicyclobacillus fastidiosus]
MSEPSSNRPSWDEYFMMMARDVVAQRATCNRRKVGAVIVRNKRILTTGYNGSPPGMPHCTDVGCWEVDGHCIRTIHAEQNAIAQAALHGVSTDGATIYITAAPCVNCAKLLIASGISRVVYADEYTDSLGQQVLEEKGIQCEQYGGR